MLWRDSPFRVPVQSIWHGLRSGERDLIRDAVREVICDGLPPWLEPWQRSALQVYAADMGVETRFVPHTSTPKR